MIAAIGITKIVESKVTRPYFAPPEKVSSTLTVTSKRQVTFRRAVLEHLGAGVGDRLVVDLLPGGRAEVRAAPRRPLRRLLGTMARMGGRALTIEEINEAIAAGGAGEP